MRKGEKAVLVPDPQYLLVPTRNNIGVRSPIVGVLDRIAGSYASRVSHGGGAGRLHAARTLRTHYGRLHRQIQPGKYLRTPSIPSHLFYFFSYLTLMQLKLYLMGSVVDPK